MPKMKNFDKREYLPIGLILVMFLAAFYLNSNVPLNEEGKMAVHWNAEGLPDGYGSSFTGIWLLPIMTLGIYLLFLAIPRIAVYRKNIMGFYKYYFGFKVIFILFMVFVYASTIAFNLGYAINMTSFMIPALAVLMFYIGYILQYVKRNYFMGFRTPWALSSEKVWKKTHAVASKAFRAYAIILLFGLVFQKYLILIFIIPLVILIFGITIYSYVIYRQK